MAEFLEQRLPSDIAYGSQWGPEYATEVVVLGSGHEQRNELWSQGRGRGNVAYGVKTPDQLAALIRFFRAVRGRAVAFRFKDKSDFQALGQHIATGNGAATAFQLIKGYTQGAESDSRTITKPVAGTVRIYLDGIEQLAGWSVETTTGLVTFSSPPADGAAISADFDFDVPVRFDTDHLPTQFDQYAYGSVPDVPIVEVRA